MSEYSQIKLDDEMRHSYIEYAMSVIVGRALPDVRDGLKPVHRRVLFSMHELNNGYNKAYKKSARIVGDVIGKYHPHGDTAVYDTIVRLAQPFSMRYPLVDGQGNFGSIDGDSPAAMRYTEVRMSRLSHELLSDIDKNTVDFNPNYDGSENEPTVLPTRIPNLLINGASGIAVGMATNIPPHNLNEVIDGVIAIIKNPSLANDEFVDDFIRETGFNGPDFPTGAEIKDNGGIYQAIKTGRGSFKIRAIHSVEEKQDKNSIIIHELPYQVNKAKLIENIALLVRDKKISGINHLRDESDRDGLRIVIELKKGEQPDVILSSLYKQTNLQTSFSVNMVCLVDGEPCTISIPSALSEFIKHRREVITRRTLYQLNKTYSKAHILEGLSIALNNIDEIINLIKKFSFCVLVVVYNVSDLINLSSKKILSFDMGWPTFTTFFKVLSWCSISSLILLDLSFNSEIIFSEFIFKFLQFSNSTSIFFILSFLFIESLSIDLFFPYFSA